MLRANQKGEDEGKGGKEGKWEEESAILWFISLNLVLV